MPTGTSAVYFPSLISAPAVDALPSTGMNAIDPTWAGSPLTVTVPVTVPTSEFPQPTASRAAARIARARQVRIRFLSQNFGCCVGHTHVLPPQRDGRHVEHG